MGIPTPLMYCWNNPLASKAKARTGSGDTLAFLYGHESIPDMDCELKKPVQQLAAGLIQCMNIPDQKLDAVTVRDQ